MVLNGLDHLADAAPWLKGRRLGLITSTSGVTRMLTSGIDAIHAQFPLTALFGPEHGVRGDHDAGAAVETYTDPATRLPVYSLYRKDSQHMTPEMLDLVDTVIYDIQDIGARFYTYISTLLYVMRDCAAAGKSGTGKSYRDNDRLRCGSVAYQWAAGKSVGGRNIARRASE